MRRIGKGHAGASKFCSVMNMPPPPRPKYFKKSSRVIAKHAKTVAKKSMKAAEKEVCVLQQNEDVDGTKGTFVMKRVCYGYVDRYRPGKFLMLRH